jgi:hypothetical protein
VPVESSRQREIRTLERSDGEQRKWMGTHYELSLVVGHTSRVILGRHQLLITSNYWLGS